jgi:hypothetical protein
MKDSFLPARIKTGGGGKARVTGRPGRRQNL